MFFKPAHHGRLTHLRALNLLTFRLLPPPRPSLRLPLLSTPPRSPPVTDPPGERCRRWLENLRPLPHPAHLPFLGVPFNPRKKCF